jgi:copper chaperone CopZ
MTGRFLAALILLLGALLSGPRASAVDSSVLKLKVDHLACLPCAQKFKEELSSVCKELTLDVQAGEATCTYQAPVTPKQILKKANKTGLTTKCIGDVRVDD